MTPLEAQKKLKASARSRKKATGPPSLGFNVGERNAVRVSAHDGRTQLQIAVMAGLSLITFKRACEADERLRQAWQLGIDDRLYDRRMELQGTAKASQNPRQIAAINTLLRIDHGLGEGHLTGSVHNQMNININANTIAQAIDGRTYAALMKRLVKQIEQPDVIEHKPEQAVIVDPIASLKAKQETGHAG